MKEILLLLRQLPILKVALFFVAGIVVSEELGWSFALFILLLIPSIALVLFGFFYKSYGKRWCFGFGLLGLFFILGYYYTTAYRANFPRVGAVALTSLTVKVDDNPIRTRVGCRFTSTVIDAPDSLSFLKGVKLQVYSSSNLAIDATSAYRIRASVKGFDEPCNPYEFSFKSYYERNGVFGVAYLAPMGIMRVGEVNPNPIKSLALSLQRFAVNTFIKCGIADNELGVLLALMIGDKQFLDNELKSSYSNIGAMHILAVSGMHVALYYMVLIWLFFFLRGRWGSIIRNLLIIVALWIFALVAGFSPSIVRATVMFTFIVVGKTVNRSYNTYNIISASFLVLLLYNPLYLYDVGFLLSYAAVISILLFYPYFKEYRPSGIVNGWLFDMAAVSICAQGLTLPLTLYYFHQFPVIFLLTNTILIPLTTIIIYGGLILLAFSWSVTLSTLLSSGLVWLLKVTNMSVDVLERLPGAVVGDISISRWQMCLLFASFLLFYFYLLVRKPRILLLSLSFILISALGALNQKFTKQNSVFVAYYLKHGTALYFGGGLNSVCLCDSVRDRYSYKFMDQSLLRWGRPGVGSVIFRTISDSVNRKEVNYRRGWMSFANKTFYIATERFRKNKLVDERVTADYLIVCRGANSNPDILLSYIKPKMIIIDGSLSKHAEEKWERKCLHGNIPFHSVAENGAFVIVL